MITTYLYPHGYHGTAALHLLDHSALAYCTEREVTFYAGADCIKVTQASPRLSPGEQVLWEALDAFARESGLVDLNTAAHCLDSDNLRVLHEAIGIAFGLAREVA